VLECVANGYVLTKARIYDDRIVQASADEGSESGRPGGRDADADTFDVDAFILGRVEDILDSDPTAPGVGDSGALDGIDSLEYGDCGDVCGAAACSAPTTGSAAAGPHIANPYYSAVPATSASASSSSAPAPVRHPVHHLVPRHARLLLFTGPTIRRLLPAAPTHTQHAGIAFGHLKHRWIDHRELPLGLYEYLKAILGGGGDDEPTSISESAERRFFTSMTPALQKKIRQRALPTPEEAGNTLWGEKGKGGKPYKDDTTCGAIQKNGKPCQNNRTNKCKSGKCGVLGHCPDAQCTEPPPKKT